MLLPLVIEQIFNAQPGMCACVACIPGGDGQAQWRRTQWAQWDDSVEPAKKQRKEDRGQQKISTMLPKLAAHAGTTFLGTIIAVTLMLLKGVGANKK
jgi:hypothetical protein